MRAPSRLDEGKLLRRQLREIAAYVEAQPLR